MKSAEHALLPWVALSLSIGSLAFAGQEPG